jgi:predicted short-subunit dehydrogenase-like oxidoreductase (DUF2520 family)
MSVSIIGSGNVAFHLYQAFIRNSITVDRIICRNFNKSSLLFGPNAPLSQNKDLGSTKTDIVLLCVKDEAIEEVVNSVVFPPNTIVLHTSGATNLEVLARTGNRHGVLYPLQSLSIGRSIQFEEVPLLIEANESSALQAIKMLAENISNNVVSVNSTKRLHIHIAAVIINNFTNYLMFMAQEHLNKRDISLQLLEPLIEETIKKALELGPINAQTGPAVRGDKKTINKHLSIIEGDIKPFYKLFSQQIMEKMGQNNK